jgi:hypothetical protein
MIGLIPELPDPAALYRLSPWWCILHHLMQSTTVLLLSLSFGMMHWAREDAIAVSNTTKKAIRWLHYMSEENLASHRAWTLCDRFIRSIAPNIGLDISDLPSIPCYRAQPPPQPSWTTGMSSNINITTTNTTNPPAAGYSNTRYRRSTPAAQQPSEFFSRDSTLNDDMTYASIGTDYDEYFFPYNDAIGDYTGSIFHAPNGTDLRPEAKIP